MTIFNTSDIDSLAKYSNVILSKSNLIWEKVLFNLEKLEIYDVQPSEMLLIWHLKTSNYTNPIPLPLIEEWIKSNGFIIKLSDFEKKQYIKIESKTYKEKTDPDPTHIKTEPFIYLTSKGLKLLHLIKETIDSAAFSALSEYSILNLSVNVAIENIYLFLNILKISKYDINNHY